MQAWLHSINPLYGTTDKKSALAEKPINRTKGSNLLIGSPVLGGVSPWVPYTSQPCDLPIICPAVPCVARLFPHVYLFMCAYEQSLWVANRRATVLHCPYLFCRMCLPMFRCLLELPL